MNIDEMLKEFDAGAACTETLLNEMLRVISEGRVPAGTDVEKLDDTIENLRRYYDQIYSTALSQLCPEEMPKKGASAAEYAQAVRNSVLLQYRKQLEEIKKTLEDFISVQSFVGNYAAALQPFQQKAAELMQKISSGEASEAEDIDHEAKGPKLFMESLACDDLDTDEGLELLDQVGEHYPRRVQNGLAAGKYFLPAADVPGTVDESCAEQNSTLAEDDTGSAVGNDHPESSLDTEMPEEHTGISEGKDRTDMQTEQTSDVSDFVRTVCDAGLILEETDDVGKLTVTKNANEKKKVTSSIFRNDIRKGNENILKRVVKDVIAQDNITVRYLTLMRGMPEDTARSALEYLLRNGYLREYRLTTGDAFYCASRRLINALEFKDAAKMVGIGRRMLADRGEELEDRNTSAAGRSVYRKLYCDSIQLFNEEGYSQFAESGVNLTESFISVVSPKDKGAACDINIGVFWNSPDECDHFLERLHDLIQNIREQSVRRAVFAALHTEKAMALADVLTGILQDELTADEILLYDFQNDQYCACPEKPGAADTYALKTVVEEESAVEEETAGEEESAGEKETVQEEAAPEEAGLQRVLLTASGSNGAAAAGQKKQSFGDKLKESAHTGNGKPSVKYGSAGSDAAVHMENIMQLIIEDKFYAASAYAGAYAVQNSNFSLFRRQLAYALNDPMIHCNYSTDNTFQLIEGQGEFEDAIVISTAVRTFFSNQVRYDYNLKSYYSGINGLALLKEYSGLSNVLYTLLEFKNCYQKGMDAYADYRCRSKAELEQKLINIRKEAGDFYNNFVLKRQKEKASQKRFLETKKLLFSIKSDIGQYIKAVADNETDMIPMALDFLQENFYKDNSTIEEDTIDDNKLWEYITVFWEKAGSQMMYRKHTDLVSHLRTNITNMTKKAVQIIARWCDLVTRINIRTEDEGAVAYKKAKNHLINDLNSTIIEMEEAHLKDQASSEKKAGLHILIYTLREILACLDGSYEEGKRRFFYVPFLLTDDVMLDENYMPDFDMHSSTLESLQLTNRIMEHVNKIRTDHLSFNDRLTEILDNKGDDYGAAALIVDYLTERGSTEELGERAGMIETGIAYARETAALRRDDFIGSLELAQSYGQIDNSVEDKKEKIRQIVDEWYEWANETFNYGFFKRVMDGYLAEIKEEAKSREDDLLKQLESFREISVPEMTAEAKRKRVERIRAMIEEQNYTVAEDLLSRPGTADEEYENVIDEDFLKDFLNHYDDYYQPVATLRTSFANLVSSRTRNKEARGAKRLADNWLPGGGPLGQEKLNNLLTCLGFRVDVIHPQDPIGKFENFIVRTKNGKGGRGGNYTHPIAAFGSGAARDGFRVVCINGAYNADRLIDAMKEIGNKKHTLILLDCALSMSERRRLARKSKSDLGDKLIAVADRTVMMFLIRNYDEMKINRMLMSLVVPFGYYQPYVWESANVMPPELFMGRKRELEKIESPSGVHIVYGGRQLGKSALLKKAKDDIDGDENGDRAVLIDIKGLDYKKAAAKIAQELYDEGILEQEIRTEDWNELSRVVRRRLKQGKKPIPYLLLLLDEADTFIESCGGEVNYQPIDALKEIQSAGTGQFKFVIAGLRNIVRFKREALGNNSVLTHLESMTVKPFNTSEARELMEIPLHYLGLRFPKDKESLITLILASTNYFPGLIQLYCAKLIEAMRNHDYAKYDEVDTPIYEVNEEHIKKVLADPEFTQQIREKYIITLKLDEDNYYYLIALLMASLYHDNGYSDGYSAAEIRERGTYLEIKKIAELDIARLEAFMEELEELNVLRSIQSTETNTKRYLFTRFTFFQMMGTRDEVDNNLEKYMG